jgi:hypothetical protein
MSFLVEVVEEDEVAEAVVEVEAVEEVEVLVEVGDVLVEGEVLPPELFLLAAAALTFSSISVEDLRSLAVSSVRVAGLGTEAALLGSVDHGWNLLAGGDPTPEPSAAKLRPLSTGEDEGDPGCLIPGG